jgi:hypothetical protein
MTKTLAEIKADVKEYGDNFAEEVGVWSWFPVKAEWDAKVEAIKSIEKWSDKIYHNTASYLICAAENNAYDSADVEIELFVNGEATGVTQSPAVNEYHEGNTAHYTMCIMTLRSMIDDIASEDYDFYKTLCAAI